MELLTAVLFGIGCVAVGVLVMRHRVSISRRLIGIGRRMRPDIDADEAERRLVFDEERTLRFQAVPGAIALIAIGSLTIVFSIVTLR